MDEATNSEKTEYESLLIDDVFFWPNGMRIQWTDGSYFGEVTFVKEHGDINIDHEHMSKKFVSVLLTKLVEKYYK